MRTRHKIALGIAAVALAGVGAGALRGQEAPEVRTRTFTASGGGYLGVYISEVDDETVERLKLPEERGALITGVADEGPAKEAGLKKDDVIVSWNGDRVESAIQLRRLLRETPAGRTVKLGVVRDGRRRTVEVRLGEGGAGFAIARAFGRANAHELQEELERSRKQLDRARSHMERLPRLRWMAFGGGRLGVTIQTLGEQLGEYFGLGDRTGVLVTEVREDSPAAKAGLKAGDVILAVGDQEVEDPTDVARIVRESEAGPLSIRVLRDRKERTVTVELPESGRAKWKSEELESFLMIPGDEDAELDFHLDLPDVEHVWESLETVMEELEPLWENGFRFRIESGSGVEPVKVPDEAGFPASRAI